MFRVLSLFLLVALIILGWVMCQTVEDLLRAFPNQARTECGVICGKQSASIEPWSPLHILLDLGLTEQEAKTILEDSFKNYEDTQRTNAGDVFGFLNFNEMEESTFTYSFPIITTSHGLHGLGFESLAQTTKIICEQELESNKSNTVGKGFVLMLQNMLQNLNRN